MPIERMMLAGVALLGVVAFVFVPTAIAFVWRHPERRRIARINGLALFSFLLWFALIVWAVGGKRDDSLIARLVGDDRHRGRLTAIVAVLVTGGIATTAYALTHR